MKYRGCGALLTVGTRPHFMPWEIGPAASAKVAGLDQRDDVPGRHGKRLAQGTVTSGLLIFREGERLLARTDMLS